MEPLTKVIRSAYIDRKDGVTALNEFAFAYRVTPHSSTNISLADLMFQCLILYSIPDAANKLNHIDLEEKLELKDQTKKELATDYATLSPHSKPFSFSVVDLVHVKQPCKNKLSFLFNPYPYRIIA